MLTREIAIATVKEFLAKCKEQNIIFSKVILFGSVVNGIITPTSDIDVMLVSDQFGYSRLKNAQLIVRIQKHYYLIEAHTYPTEYFEKGDPFINEVLKTGIEIQQ